MTAEETVITAEMMLLVMEEEMDKQESRIKLLRRIGFELLTRLAKYENDSYMHWAEDELNG